MTNDVNATLIQHHFAELQVKYPELTLGQNLFGEWIVRGPIRASAIYETTEISIEGITIEIILPCMYPEIHPIARESTGLTEEFHTFPDGTLCLGSPLAVKATFKKYPTILGFVEQLVIPYFYSFKYWKDHGKVPFGELSHGGRGILEYYVDLFGITEVEKVIGFLRILADNDYRGHLPCPCGSKAIIRRCHGDMLRKISTLQKADDFLMDYYCIARYHLENRLTIPLEFLLRRLTTKKKRKRHAVNSTGIHDKILSKH